MKRCSVFMVLWLLSPYSKSLIFEQVLLFRLFGGKLSNFFLADFKFLLQGTHSNKIFKKNNYDYSVKLVCDDSKYA